MKVVLSALARHDLDGKINYLIDQGAAHAARRLKTRVVSFLRQYLANHPRIGSAIGHRDLYECWITGTQIVIWCRIKSTEIEIALFWHTSQNRQPA